MKSTRTKICGITNIDDAKAAVAAGADAIGLVFYAASPRAVSITQARSIAVAVGPFVTVTGLFVDADPGFVQSVLAQVPLHLLQFHGDESVQYCESFQRPYIKAVRMKPGLDPDLAITDFPSATGILLDAYAPHIPGGTGATFDWDRVPRNSTIPVILAGGLTPENVASAASIKGIYGVDVSGGVESAPGKKDHDKILSFIFNAQREIQ